MAVITNQIREESGWSICPCHRYRVV